MGVILDSKLIFDEHLKMVSLKNITLGLLRKLQNLLPRSTLITIYKAFVRPHLDYGDILYKQAYNMSFHQNREAIQYNPCLAITGAIRGTSITSVMMLVPKTSNVLQNLQNQSPKYIFKLIPEKTHAYAT